MAFEHNLSVSQMSSIIPSNKKNAIVDLSNFNPPAAEEWESVVLPTVFVGSNWFGDSPSQFVRLQDVQSNERTDDFYSSAVSRGNTNFDLYQHGLEFGSTTTITSLKSPVETRRQPKRQSYHVSEATGTHSRDGLPPSATAVAASNRSERARKAANRRHSRAKMTVSLESRKTKADTDREKNRKAAAKCRAKKHAATNALDAEYRVVTAANGSLMQEHRELGDQLASWRTLALQHISGLCGCHCSAIHRYNANQAMKAVSSMDASEIFTFSS